MTIFCSVQLACFVIVLSIFYHIDSSSNNDDDRFQKIIIIPYSDTQSHTDHCIYADDLLRKNIETFVINAGHNVDANALECLTNDECIFMRQNLSRKSVLGT